MSTQINVSHAQKFRGDFLLLSQQRGSRLQDTIRRDPDYLQGKAGYFERIGTTAMVKRTTRHADTPLVNTPHSRRRVTLDDWEWADLIDSQDIARMLASPQNKYVVNATNAKGRQIDDLIIAAANGNAYSMDAADAATAVPLPAGQKIAVAGTGLTLAKLLSAKEMLDAAEVDENEPRFLICQAKQMTNLLNTTEVKSADYNTVKALVEGRIDTFLGFKFKRSQRLTVDGSSSRLCLAYAMNGIGLAIGEEPEFDIGPRRDKGNSTQVYLKMSMGAARIEDEKVVQIACSES